MVITPAGLGQDRDRVTGQDRVATTGLSGTMVITPAGLGQDRDRVTGQDRVATTGLSGTMVTK